jgi:hypothetical protein
MKNLSFIMLIFSTLLLDSCISLNKEFQTYTVQTKSVEHDPVKADIKIDTTKRLWGISTSSYFLF